MIGKQIRPRGQVALQTWLTAGGIQIIVAFLVYYYTSSHCRLAQLHQDGASSLPSTLVVNTKARLTEEHAALQQRVFAFNQQAAALGESKQELYLDLTSHRTALTTSLLKANSPTAGDPDASRRQAAAEAVRGSLNSMATLTAAVSTATSSSGAAAPLCIDAPDPRYPMKSKAEVTLEQPALAQALAKHAVNNEIMFALVNGVMICKVREGDVSGTPTLQASAASLWPRTTNRRQEQHIHVRRPNTAGKCSIYLSAGPTLQGSAASTW